MPAKPPTPCRHYGCKALVSPSGYCEAHKQERTGWFKTSTRSSKERGYGNKWTKLRRLALMRDHGLCQVCLKNRQITAGQEIDHIVPKSAGGTDELANLQVICKPCHKAKTGRESNSLG